MSEFKAMKFWIGDDPELSEKVQKILLGQGYRWGGGEDAVKYTEEYALFTRERDGLISRNGDNRDFFDKQGSEEINIDWMRTQKPEAIELNGKAYIKSELEEALRHIKPVGE